MVKKIDIGGHSGVCKGLALRHKCQDNCEGDAHYKSYYKGDAQYKGDYKGHHKGDVHYKEDYKGYYKGDAHYKGDYKGYHKGDAHYKGDYKGHHKGDVHYKGDYKGYYEGDAHYKGHYNGYHKGDAHYKGHYKGYHGKDAHYKYDWGQGFPWGYKGYKPGYRVFDNCCGPTHYEYKTQHVVFDCGHHGYEKVAWVTKEPVGCNCNGW